MELVWVAVAAAAEILVDVRRVALAAVAAVVVVAGQGARADMHSRNARRLLRELEEAGSGVSRQWTKKER